jgi:hypothetical protein
MPSTYGYRLTISKLMALVCAVGIVLALFAIFPDDSDAVIGLIFVSLVFVVPIHFAIEGNRRDAIAAHRAGEDEAA